MYPGRHIQVVRVPVAELVERTNTSGDSRGGQSTELLFKRFYVNDITAEVNTKGSRRSTSKRYICDLLGSLSRDKRCIDVGFGPGDIQRNTAISCLHFAFKKI